MSYTNLYDYPGLGLVDLFFSPVCIWTVPQPEEVPYVSHVIIKHAIITLYQQNMINDIHP